MLAVITFDPEFIGSLLLDRDRRRRRRHHRSLSGRLGRASRGSGSRGIISRMRVADQADAIVINFLISCPTNLSGGGRGMRS